MKAMGTATEPTLEQLSEEQLLSLPHLGKTEMIDGRLIVAPAGFEHGGICGRFFGKVWQFVERERIGMVFDSSTGFYMKSGNLLSPDVAFVAAARLKGMKTLPRKYFRGSPDLCAEVLSPNDRPAEMDRKIAEYFETDTKLAWVANPKAQTVDVFRESKLSQTLRAGESISGEDIIPGFTLAIDELFAPPDFR